MRNRQKLSSLAGIVTMAIAVPVLAAAQPGTPGDIPPPPGRSRQESVPKSDQHRIVGKVLDIDRELGLVRLATDEGVLVVQPSHRSSATCGQQLRKEVTRMVNVTERAKEKLRELLTSQSDDPSVGLRLDRVSTGELGIFPDRERADDQVVEDRGRALLLVGQEIAQTMGDTTVDCDESEPGPRLVIRKS